MVDLNFLFSIKFTMDISSVVGLSPSRKSIIKSRYTASEIHAKLCMDEATITEYNTYLHGGYPRNNIKVEELAILDNQSRKPWFASKIFHGIDSRAKPNIYAAIEEMRKGTDGKLFGNSPDSEHLTLNALGTRDESLSSADLRYFKEIEVIVLAQEQMLKVK